MRKKQKSSALTAGFSLIIMAIAAGVSFGVVYSDLVVDNPESTFQNIVSKASLFKTGLAGWVVVFATDLIVAWSLYIFFKSTHRSMAMLTGIIRLVYTLILGVAIFNLFSVLPWIKSYNASDLGPAVQQVRDYLSAFENIWSLGLIIFGLHLIGLGYLAIKSSLTPNIFGYLLLLAGVCYSFVHTAQQTDFIAEHSMQTIESVLAIPMTLGEMLFAFWLIYFGFKKTRA